jgi:hypothetical protein
LEVTILLHLSSMPAVITIVTWGVIMMATPQLALRYSWGRFVSILGI